MLNLLFGKDYTFSSSNFSTRLNINLSPEPPQSRSTPKKSGPTDGPLADAFLYSGSRGRSDDVYSSREVFEAAKRDLLGIFQLQVQGWRL